LKVFVLRIASLGLVVCGFLILLAVIVGRRMTTVELAIDPSTSGKQDIVLVDQARNLAQRLTWDDSRNHSPVWSPDGARLAYMATRGDQQRVMIADLERGSRWVLFSGPAGDPNSTSIAWSPDGGRVAFTALDGNRLVIYVMKVEPSTAAHWQITTNIASAFTPGWSPDGEHLTFSWSPVANTEVYSVPLKAAADTPVNSASLLQRLTFDPGLDTAPAWSPDGKMIAFVSDRDNNSEIYIVPADCPAVVGGCAQQLQRVTRHPARDIAPAWSPDGLYLTFASNRHGRFQVYRMASACLTQNLCPVEPLTQYAGDVLHAAWRPDSAG
jgi:Tol biopolymer transport system component